MTKLTADELRIEEIKKNILDGYKMCPVLITQDGYVVDGNKRVLAARRARMKSIPAVVIPYEIADVILDHIKLTWIPIEDK